MPANIQQHLLTVLETKWMYLNSILTLQIEEIFHFTNKSVMSDVQIDICFRALTHVPLFQVSIKWTRKKVCLSLIICIANIQMSNWIIDLIDFLLGQRTVHVIDQVNNTNSKKIYKL